MKTNWLKVLELDHTCMRDQNVAVLLDDFFENYYYIGPTIGGNFIIKGIENGDEVEVQKVDKGYRVRKTIINDDSKKVCDDKLLYFKDFRTIDETKIYTGAIESYKTYVTYFNHTNERLHVKRRLCYSFENKATKLYSKATDKFIGYDTELDPYARIQTDGIYVDLDNKEKVINSAPDLCTGVITQPNDDGTFMAVNYDIVDGEKSITRIADVTNDLSLVKYIINSENERIEMLKPFPRKKLKPKKVGFRID